MAASVSYPCLSESPGVITTRGFAFHPTHRNPHPGDNEGPAQWLGLVKIWTHLFMRCQQCDRLISLTQACRPARYAAHSARQPSRPSYGRASSLMAVSSPVTSPAGALLCLS